MEPELAPEPARILVVDNDPKVRRDLRELFGLLGYRVEAPEGAGEGLIWDATNCARRFRPHVAIVDLRLVDDEVNRNDGLALTADLKPARVVLYTGFDNTRITREALVKYGVVSVVNKAESSDALVEEVQQAARQACAALRGLRIAHPPACSAARLMQALQLDLDGDGLPDLPYDVLALAFRDETELRVEPLIDAADDAQAVPRGRSVLLRVWKGSQIEPHMLKYAPVAKVQAEKQNYDAFVDGNVPAGFHTRFIDCVLFHDLGAALYNFLGVNGRPLETLAQAFPRLSDTEQQYLLRHFFVDVWGGLYRARQPLHGTLFERYDGFLRLQKRLNRAGERPDLLWIDGLPAVLPNPFRWLGRSHARSRPPGCLQEARTHGDLHTGNLLTDGEHTWVIDFERTGWGPLLRDFVELEIDLVTRLVQPANPQPAYALALAQALCQPFDPRQPALASPLEADLATVRWLRALAVELTGGFDPLEYLWGLLFEAILVADLSPHGSTAQTRALILAATAAEVLERLA